MSHNVVAPTGSQLRSEAEWAQLQEELDDKTVLLANSKETVRILKSEKKELEKSIASAASPNSSRELAQAQAKIQELLKENSELAEETDAYHRRESAAAENDDDTVDPKPSLADSETYGITPDTNMVEEPPSGLEVTELEGLHIQTDLLRDSQQLSLAHGSRLKDADPDRSQSSPYKQEAQFHGPPQSSMTFGVGGSTRKSGYPTQRQLPPSSSTGIIISLPPAGQSENLGYTSASQLRGKKSEPTGIFKGRLLREAKARGQAKFSSAPPQTKTALTTTAPSPTVTGAMPVKIEQEESNPDTSAINPFPTRGPQPPPPAVPNPDPLFSKPPAPTPQSFFPQRASPLAPPMGQFATGRQPGKPAQNVLEDLQYPPNPKSQGPHANPRVKGAPPQQAAPEKLVKKGQAGTRPETRPETVKKPGPGSQSTAPTSSTVTKGAAPTSYAAAANKPRADPVKGEPDSDPADEELIRRVAAPNSDGTQSTAWPDPHGSDRGPSPYKEEPPVNKDHRQIEEAHAVDLSTVAPPSLKIITSTERNQPPRLSNTEKNVVTGWQSFGTTAARDEAKCREQEAKKRATRLAEEERIGVRPEFKLPPMQETWKQVTFGDNDQRRVSKAIKRTTGLDSASFASTISPGVETKGTLPIGNAPSKENTAPTQVSVTQEHPRGNGQPQTSKPKNETDQPSPDQGEHSSSKLSSWAAEEDDAYAEGQHLVNMMAEYGHAYDATIPPMRIPSPAPPMASVRVANKDQKLLIEQILQKATWRKKG